MDGEEGFERIRDEFQKEAKSREEEVEAVSKALDHAFDFMEDAFGDSQEMVSFVTELNTNYYSIWFLKENDCSKYYKYNKGLLFDQRHEAVQKELDDIETYLSGADSLNTHKAQDHAGDHRNHI